MAGDGSDPSMSVQVYLGIMLITLFPICVFVVLYYAEPGFPYQTYITLVLGYYATYGILLVVPIDIASVVFDRLSTETGDSPQYDADKSLMSDVYNTFFTMILILGSFVLILEEYINSDGTNFRRYSMGQSPILTMLPCPFSRVFHIWLSFGQFPQAYGLRQRHWFGSWRHYSGRSD